MELLRAEPGLTVGDNEPETKSDATDYTVPVHGEQRQLPHLAIEIRQDLIAEGSGTTLVGGFAGAAASAAGLCGVHPAIDARMTKP